MLITVLLRKTRRNIPHAGSRFRFRLEGNIKIIVDKENTRVLGLVWMENRVSCERGDESFSFPLKPNFLTSRATVKFSEMYHEVISLKMIVRVNYIINNLGTKSSFN